VAVVVVVVMAVGMELKIAFAFNDDDRNLSNRKGTKDSSEQRKGFHGRG